MSLDYKALLRAATADLQNLQHQKETLHVQQTTLTQQEREIDKKIEGMAQVVAGLSPLVPEEPPDPSILGILGLVGKVLVDVGLSAKTRLVLQAAAPRALSATEIRTELQKAGFYLGDYSNALAAIHTTLNRLAASPEVEAISGPDGKRFRWRGTPASSLPSVLPSPAQLPTGLKVGVGPYRKRHVRLTRKATMPTSTAPSDETK
jgi:hypothetical protein